MAQDNSEKFLESLGGEAGCRRLAQEFYARVATDPELRALFPGKSLRCATEEFSAFLIQFLGGSEDKTQYRWWVSLRESHARFQISQLQRAAWLGHMRSTLASQIQDHNIRSSLEQFFQETAGYVVQGEEPDIANSELLERWSEQRALDQIIAHITHGRDSEAIESSQEFLSRPTVLVGIFARMMATGREPFISFIVDSVKTSEHLSAARFNGRTLLHFSAKYACLPLVRELLSVGVDPNIADGGGHSPLYLAASSDGSELASEVVRALINAGAKVDFAGGIMRSTPLHEAARHGNLPLARALLEAGANHAAKDKKGLTPLDRARGCRRHEMVLLLEGLIG